MFFGRKKYFKIKKLSLNVLNLEVMSKKRSAD